MAMKRANIQRQLVELRNALSGVSSWRIKGAILVAAVGVVALAVLAASRPADPVTRTAAFEAEPEEAAAPVVPVQRKTSRARKNTPVKTVASAPVEVRKTTAAAAPAPAAPVAGDESAVVTLSGCLEQDDDVFRLKDTEGLNAPKSRSWKSGFLRKKAARVDVVDASNRLRLQNHVGHRVSVTGLLYEKELLANSVKRISNSCEE